jgi:hypothetical protein
MKFRKLMPSFVLGLMIAISGVGFAQNASQSGKKMDSCCCCSDSCPMTKDGAMKNHTTSSDKHEGCCCGDSCSMKDGARKDGAMKSDKHDCCCGGDSCNMKDMNMKMTDMKDMKAKP